ncbi:MAG: NAD-dependent epimerase/dehydratase family protein [Acidimicrobiales bacterium]
MRAVVTGAAGFVGSHLTEALLAAGHRVVGIDAFTPYYDPAIKRSNLAGAIEHPSFRLVDTDLRSTAPTALADLVDGTDVVFHLAAQPGVRSSWSRFDDYQSHNVVGTHRLLEACRAGQTGPARVVVASSSSVYGNAPAFPTRETTPPRPHSPYGVTKLAAEHLSHAYAANWGIPTVVLRYFTVYGPRQRPDMAFHRLFEAARGGRPFELYGDGSQVRDFTYVDDAVAATLLGATASIEPGTVVNIAGGSAAAVAEVVRLAGVAAGRPVPVTHRPAQPGDVTRTGASIERAQSVLGWRPAVDLRDGLARQAAWHRSL